MRSLWLLLALLLLLPPAPAAASERVPVSGGESYVAAPGHDLGDQVRGGIGFELRTPQGRGDGRTPRWSLPDPEAPDPFRLSLPLSPVRGDLLPAPEGSAPLCEHLPYDATAPPLRG